MSPKREQELRIWIAGHVRFIEPIRNSPVLAEEAIKKLLSKYEGTLRRERRVRRGS